MKIGLALVNIFTQDVLRMKILLFDYIRLDVLWTKNVVQYFLFTLMSYFINRAYVRAPHEYGSLSSSRETQHRHLLPHISRDTLKRGTNAIELKEN